MSKSVRLKDYLAAELEIMAKRENRSLANLVNKLLEQAIAMAKVEPPAFYEERTQLRTGDGRIVTLPLVGEEEK